MLYHVSFCERMHHRIRDMSLVLWYARVPTVPGPRYFFPQASSVLITINGRVYRAGAFDACAMDNAAVRYTKYLV